jgi:hypothetical protein
VAQRCCTIAPQRMGSRRFTLIGASVVYSALALAFLVGTPFLERVGEPLPKPLLALLLTVVGPAILLSAGIDAWPVVAVAVVLIAAFLGLARLAWRRSPDTEWFAVWIIFAGVVWAGSGWLLAALAV